MAFLESQSNVFSTEMENNSGEFERDFAEADEVSPSWGAQQRSG